MSWNWGEAPRIILLVLVPVVLVILGLVLLKQILLPFLVGLAAAYMLDPSADRLERVGFGRTSATALITVGFFIILAIVVLLLLPPLATQAGQLAAELPNYIDRLRDRLLPVITWLVENVDIGSDLSAEGLIREQAGQAIGVFMRSVTGLLQSGIALLNLIALIFVTPIVTFYMLRDWDRMVAQIRSLVPPQHRSTFDRLGDEIDEVLAGFLRGAGLVCTFLACFYAVGLELLDLRYGLIIGILTGFFSFIPFIGMALGLVVGVAVAAFQFPDALWKVFAVVGVFGAGQFIEGNLISPRLVGSRIHLHPIWMIFAVLAGTALFGILGTLLAVPFAAVLGVLIRFGIEKYRQSDLFDPTEDAEADVDPIAADTPMSTTADQPRSGTHG